jgi:hypothetical protein
LYQEAAESGHGAAQWRYGELVFKESDWERYLWWGQAVDHVEYFTLEGCMSAAIKQLAFFDNGVSGRIIFEIGAACKNKINMGDCFWNPR